tara:strand:+ start:9433 stop:9765 length:333 start_codon:yes stop_codon:yes gene_type:complete
MSRVIKPEAVPPRLIDYVGISRFAQLKAYSQVDGANWQAYRREAILISGGEYRIDNNLYYDLSRLEEFGSSVDYSILTSEELKRFIFDGANGVALEAKIITFSILEQPEN